MEFVDGNPIGVGKPDSCFYCLNIYYSSVQYLRYGDTVYVIK